jgi:hypothetical protein
VIYSQSAIYFVIIWLITCSNVAPDASKIPVLHQTDQPFPRFEPYLTLNWSRDIIIGDIKFMKQTFVKFGTIVFCVIAIAFLVVAYVANGSETETAWLYIFCIWLIVYSTFIAYPKKKDKTR